MSVIKLVKEKKIFEEIEVKTHTDVAEEIMNDFRFATLSDTKEILLYQDGRYTDEAEILIEEECEKRIPNCMSHQVNEITKTIQRSTYVKRGSFDQYPYLINLKNGILNIVKGTFRQHTPNILFRVQIPVTYDPKIGPENFIKFLIECLPDYKDRITVFEEMASILLPGLKLEKAYLHEGEGSNGKSTLFSIIAAIGGHENTSHISIHDLINHRFARSGLDGKILNTYSEISNDEITHPGILKALISGDPVSVEKKGRDAFTLNNYARFFFSANDLPEINNFKFAELRRFIVTKWNQKFVDDPSEEDLRNGIKKTDIMLKRELTSEQELSGILNLLFFHAKKLLKNKKFTYEQSAEQLEIEWKLKTDHVEVFANTHLIKNPDEKTPKSLVYESYKQWCQKNKLTSKSEREFNSRIKKNFEDTRVKIAGKTTVVWNGMEIDQSKVTQCAELLPLQSEKQKVKN